MKIVGDRLRGVNFVGLWAKIRNCPSTLWAIAVTAQPVIL